MSIQNRTQKKKYRQLIVVNITGYISEYYTLKYIHYIQQNGLTLFIREVGMGNTIGQRSSTQLSFILLKFNERISFRKLFATIRKATISIVKSVVNGKS